LVFGARICELAASFGNRLYFLPYNKHLSILTVTNSHSHIVFFLGITKIN